MNEIKNRQALLTLRPAIPTILEANATNAAEQFQNTILRPILKFQNPLLLALMRSYFTKRKNTFYQLAANKRVDYIEQSIRKDLKFKHLLMGIVIGHFTLEEYERYVQDEKELSKRLTNLLVERFCRQVELF